MKKERANRFKQAKMLSFLNLRIYPDEGRRIITPFGK